MNSKYILLSLTLAAFFIMCDSTERVFNVQKGEEIDVVADIWDQNKAENGTTLFTYRYDTDHPKILQVDMIGNIVWEYELSHAWKQYISYGFDAELLWNGNILIMLPRYAVLEINKDGRLIWGYINENLSHDVDRLRNGHTIFTFGADDQKTDVQIKELDREGFLKWQWYARDHFNDPRYIGIYHNGWTGTNSVERLDNGHTMVCLCNFHLIAELDTSGNVLKKIGEGLLYYPHDPEVLSNGNILVATQKSPNHNAYENSPVLEIDPNSNSVVWRYEDSEWFDSQLTRDANRLSNGNTLITGSTQIIEITPDGEIVWRLKVKDAKLPLNSIDIETRGLYKSQRIQ
ncbi:aryl-sulfate sulfotransferase [candidate division KSB1 bacterium]|nr:aryl-sulfate sulfotransferase [candidate division KSB1 bacterium]